MSERTTGGPAGESTTARVRREWTRLTRSRRHKVVGGVCGGLARHFRLDPVILRVPLALLSVVGGLGLVAYGLAWLLIPFEREEENEGRRLLSGRVEGPGLTALLMILAGCGLLLAALADTGEVVWFSVLVFASMAAAAHWARVRDVRGGAAGEPGDPVVAQAAAEAPPEAKAPPPAAPSWWRDTTADGRSGQGYLWGPADHVPGARAELPRQPEHVLAPRESVPPPCPAESPHREFRLGVLVTLLALCAAVAGTALAWEGEPLGTALVVGLTAALAVFGAGLVISAFAGRVGGGTVFMTAVTALMLGGAAALPDTISTGWSEPVWRVESADALRPAYSLGTGDARLNLTALDLAADERVTTSVEAGAGQVTVLVPPDVTVEVHAEIDVGAFSYDPLGTVDDGGPVRSFGGVSQERTVTYGPQDGDAAGGTVELRLDMGIGHLAVRRAVEATS
ncbi:PspC domain-containing protein [Streptomyces avicenniae]|uniref:PspC domain-containing protein n=1 Tax=Streptomyces avicenniae TaxID=500153 RepID=UPI00069A947E|nr:PspC domain-containing protein [Streptomyces avicenniae]